MVKLDVEPIKYLGDEEFRVLTAIEMGMRNHELTPTPLIERIAKLRHGGVKKYLSNILKYKLAHHDAKMYDGYRLTYPGYDFLALKTFLKRGHVCAVGRQIGVGKESDIHLVLNANDEELVLKLHRLGRVSFRAVKSKRDYLQGRKTSNWLYMSRLSALKEFAFMRALYDEGFPVPVPIDCNRHAVLMSLIADGSLLVQVKELKHVHKVFTQCLDLIVRFAQYGLVHGDFNEFNLLYREEQEQIVVIDFPQMISTNHKDAQDHFDRDVTCIHNFFGKRFGITSDYKPQLKDIVKTNSLDVQVEASGFSKEMEQDMQEQMKQEDDEEEEEEDANLNVLVSPKDDSETTATTTTPIVEQQEEESSTMAQQQQQDIVISMDMVKKKMKQKVMSKQFHHPKDVKTAKRNALKGRDKRKAQDAIQSIDDFF